MEYNKFVEICKTFQYGDYILLSVGNLQPVKYKFKDFIFNDKWNTCALKIETEKGIRVEYDHNTIEYIRDVFKSKLGGWVDDTSKENHGFNSTIADKIEPNKYQVATDQISTKYIIQDGSHKILFTIDKNNKITITNGLDDSNTFMFVNSPKKIIRFFHAALGAILNKMEEK